MLYYDIICLILSQCIICCQTIPRSSTFLCCMTVKTNIAYHIMLYYATMLYCIMIKYIVVYQIRPDKIKLRQILIKLIILDDSYYITPHYITLNAIISKYIRLYYIIPYCTIRGDVSICEISKSWQLLERWRMKLESLKRLHNMIRNYQKYCQQQLNFAREVFDCIAWHSVV